MHLLRFFAEIVTWIFIFSMVILIGVSGYFLIDYARRQQQATSTAESQSTTSATSTHSSVAFSNEFLEYFGWGLVVASAILLCVILCLCHKIRLITAIIEATGRFINDTVFVLFVPLFNTVAAFVFIIMWVAGAVFLYATGTFKPQADWPIASVTWTEEVRYMWYFNLFAGLWILAFIVMLTDFIIACACCVWYYNQGASSGQKKEERAMQKSTNPVTTGYYWSFRYHFGSIAVGAFILALIWMIRLIFAYIHKKLKDTGATKNKFVEWAMACVHCFLACFERFIRFVNKQAFIYVSFFSF